MTLGALIVNKDVGDDAEDASWTEDASTTEDTANRDVRDHREECRSRCCEAFFQA